MTRIAGADRAELAVIELYEQANGRRESVREAAEQRLEALASEDPDR